MDYELAESEIETKLKSSAALATMADTMVLPDDVAHYKTPVAKGLATVVFMAEKFDPNQSLGEVSQESTATFNISVQARKMRGEKGVYAIAEEVKKTLLGFRPTDCGPLILGEHDFAGYQNDVWEHSITFSCKSLRAQEKGKPIKPDEVVDEEVFYKKQQTNENIHL